MNPKIESLKQKISDLKSRKGRRAKIPAELWDEVADCSKSISLPEVCQFIGIDPGNARSKIKAADKLTQSIPQLIQLPNTPVPTLELTLPSGALIKVFST